MSREEKFFAGCLLLVGWLFLGWMFWAAEAKAEQSFGYWLSEKLQHSSACLHQWAREQNK